MSGDVVISQVENKQNCLFCNAQLAVSTRNCFNIFKTILFPLEKKACDLIGMYDSNTGLYVKDEKFKWVFIAGAVLDTDITEDNVHSEVVCKKCFKLVNEFADLESRVNEIKQELNTTYKRTTEYLLNNAEDNPKPGIIKFLF